jgi:hypothetical protein
VGGDENTALGYINALRTRAYGNTTGNIDAENSRLILFLMKEQGNYIGKVFAARI